MPHSIASKPTFRCFFLEGLGHHETLLRAQEIEVATVQPFDMVGIDRVLHDLEPVAGQHRVTHVDETRIDEHVEAGQFGNRIRTDVCPHHPAQRLCLAGEGLHMAHEGGLARLRGLLDAVAGKSNFRPW